MKNGNEVKEGKLELNYACLIVLFAILLGGGTEQNLWSDHLIQVLIAPLLLLGFYRLPTLNLSGGIWVIGILSTLILILQFLPIHREFILPNSGAIISNSIWTTSPSYSIESSLFFCTCLGLFLYISSLSLPAQIRILKVVLIGVVIQSILVIIQLSYSQPVRLLGLLPFAISSGLFANENHFSTLLFSTIPILGFIFLSIQDNKKLYLLMSLIVVLLLFGIGSRAGMGFALIQFILTLVWFYSKNLGNTIKVTVFLSCMSIGVAILYFVDFSSTLESDLRSKIFVNTGHAIQDHWMFGSGLGTFVLLYPAYEPVEQILSEYVNHAHNDYLELFLEVGVIVLFPILIFIYLIIKNIFIQKTSGILGIALMAILAHSILDYPLRTFSVAVMFVVISAVIFKKE